jgi:hypothetical protein
MSLFDAGGAQPPLNLHTLSAATDASPRDTVAQREHLRSLWHASVVDTGMKPVARL